MEEEINEKYGKKFIKSLLYKADSLWVLKNIHKTFEMGGMNGAWDQCALFPGDKYYNESNHSALQEAFDKQITYAENYKSKSHQYSNATVYADVSVDKNGKAKVTDINVQFFDYLTRQQNFNKNSEKNFVKVAKEIIENNQWIPAKIKGINVNSKMNLRIYLK
ncbi:hypothetical protein MP477_17055 [Chryseobacterium sp. WG23]|uniref:hypothetical protein n=1 Tax=Chryseobacterium sp. WG23 TaxID=2926910 RepID=UPI00211DFBDB|nr:hypothetical protein [Chryseobacterium sp. WG23]MCQ9636668.1 hypothetical protein [Chryseobacterium sp. WG23]